MLINYELLSDVILPPGVGVLTDWLKPSITVLFLDATPPLELDLDNVLNTILKHCGMNPTLPVKARFADSLPDGSEPDQIDPPRWCTRIVAFLEALAPMPMAADLSQSYRATRAKFGRNAALRIYCKQLLKAMSGGSAAAT